VRDTGFVTAPPRVAAWALCLALAGLLAAACASLAPPPSALSLDEKIGQLFVFAERGGFHNDESTESRELLRRVRDLHVGGVLWFQTADVLQVARLNRRLQAAARLPLLVSADLEAGTGMRFEGTTYWPWPMAVAACGDPALAEQQGRAIGEEARAIGLNQIDAPVADVNIDPENPNINVRSYGDDPQQVGLFVAAFVRGVQSTGTIATLKHFPGHGDGHTDSHRSLPVLDATYERLERVELVPFRAGIAAGARSVMTAHLAIPSLDATPAPVRPEGPKENPYAASSDEVTQGGTTPASLSPAVTEGLLRRQLGFDGLVVTDATDMGALIDHYEGGETAVRAILAGADQVLKPPDLDAAIAAVRRAVEVGRISQERLDRSVARILAAKRWAGVPPADPEAIFRVVDSQEHRALAQQIARRAITLVREESGALPLSRRERVVLVTVAGVGERLGGDLSKELERRLPSGVPTIALDARTSDAEASQMLEAVRGADATLLCLFVRPQSGKGSISLPDAAKSAIARLLGSGARVVVISFGSPYLLASLPEAKTYLAAYGGQTDAQVSVARALFGESKISGRLPVAIPGIASRGTGIQKPAAHAAATPGGRGSRDAARSG